MDFVISFPRSKKRHDRMWAIINQLTKSAPDQANRFTSQIG